MSDAYNEAERQGAYDTPRSLDNRAGLDELRYRVGNFSSFRRTMIRKIPRTQVEADEKGMVTPLRSWSARDSDDYGIALIEMWAYVADILTFYQERIANEAFIRTAKHRDSLVRLANLLDYKPASGIAASVYLVFRMKDSSSARIRKQFPVQHVPEGEENPQIFETSDQLIASASWNELTPLPDKMETVTFGFGDEKTRLMGARARIDVGDWVLIVGKDRAEKDTESEQWELRQVVEVKRLPEADETRIVFDRPLGIIKGQRKVVVEKKADLYVFRGRGALFGYNAPDWRTLGALAAFEYLSDGQRKAVNNDENAIDPDNPAAYLRAVADAVRKQGDFPNKELTEEPILCLDSVYDKVVKDGWIAMMNSGYLEIYKIVDVKTVSRTDYTRSAQVSRLEVDTDQNFDKYGLAGDALFSRVRGTVVLLDNEQLPLAQDVASTPISGTEIDVVEDVAGLLEQGHLLLVFGETQTNGLQGEVAVVKETQRVNAEENQSGTKNRIILVEGLTYNYVRANTRIFGNVTVATHGETITDEILGNGDASIPFQRFELKQAPMTYVPQAGAPGGAAPTVKLRVNGVLWENVRSFFGHGGDKTIYTIDINDEQGTIIRTGDGRTGARLSTGHNNVSATYRKGIGKVGNVPHKSIKTPLERPKGLQKVFNPLPASGGAEREDPGSIRKNAPNTVRTFGRIVSLRDFEDAAREFVGVSKARAFIEWNKEQEWQIAKLVIAGDDGAEIVGEPFKNFVHDLNSRRDPNRKLTVVNYTPQEVTLSVDIYPHPSYLTDTVLASVRTAIAKFFAFDHLSLGQTIALSEIYKVVHSADGVIGADITRFHLKEEGEAVNDFLKIGPDHLAHLDTGSPDTYIIKIAGEA